MAITLAVGATVLTLAPDLLWTDEFAWSEVEQTTERSITGALIVSSAVRQAGRPITLAPEDESSAWMPRAAVLQMRNWAAGAGQVMTLTVHGQARSVAFRHHEPPALDATPVAHFADANDADFYRVTLRLMEI